VCTLQLSPEALHLGLQAAALAAPGLGLGLARPPHLLGRRRRLVLEDLGHLLSDGRQLLVLTCAFGLEPRSVGRPRA